MARPSHMTVLHASWRERLLPWLQTLGIDASIVVDQDMDDQSREQAHSTLTTSSWWDGNCMHLAAQPRHAAVDWIYLAAHWAVAPEERRVIVDFDLPTMKGATLTTAEEYARVVTLGTARRAGARAVVLWRLAGFWRRTVAARAAEARGIPVDDVVDWHLRGLEQDLDRCAASAVKWGVPAPPSLWETITHKSRGV